MSRLFVSAARCAWIAALVATAHAADTLDPGEALAGKARFMAECGLCHRAEPGDEGGGMGPSLNGLLGKPAATVDKMFPYTAALRGSKIVWDAALLDRFLSDPFKLVPGTAMPVMVPEKSARDELVSYFRSLSPAAPTP